MISLQMIKNINKFKIVDLFCGLGGLTTGVVDACNNLSISPEIVLANDINQACSEFYQKNFSSYLLNFSNDNIEEILDSSLDFMGEIDLVLAGPPCQGNSDLNNKTRRTDPKNSLYLKTIDFIAFYKPKYFLIENVPSVIHAKQNVVDKSLKKLNILGYEVFDFIVDFSKLGIAQSRKRHVLIGSFDKHNGIADFLSNAEKKYTSSVLSDVIFDLLDVSPLSIFDKASSMMPDNKKRAEYLFKNDEYDLPNELRPKCHQKEHSYKSMYGRMHWDKPSQTITGGFGSMGQGRFLHPKKKRVITPHEAARIQGLPDWLNFDIVKKRTELHQMIGNAVPPVLSKELIMHIMKGN